MAKTINHDANISIKKNVVGDNLGRLRRSKGFSQEALAEKFNVSLKTIGNWEQGRKRPSYEHLEIICNFYGVSPDSILCSSTEDVDFYKKNISINPYSYHIYHSQKIY